MPRRCGSPAGRSRRGEQQQAPSPNQRNLLPPPAGAGYDIVCQAHALIAFKDSGNDNGLIAPTAWIPGSTAWLPGTDLCADGWNGVCCGPGRWDESDYYSPTCPAGGTGAEVTGLYMDGYGVDAYGFLANTQASTHPLWPVPLACALWLACL